MRIAIFVGPVTGLTFISLLLRCIRFLLWLTLASGERFRIVPSSDGTLQEVSNEKVSGIKLAAVVVVDIIQSLRVGISGANVEGVRLRLSVGGGIGGG